MLYFWILFNIFALGMLVLDLRVFHRPGHVVGFREALGWSAMYVALAAHSPRSSISGRDIRPASSSSPDMFSNSRSASIIFSFFS